MTEEPENQSRWQPVKDLMGNRQIDLGQILSYQFHNSPRRILFTMSYYKFATKLIGTGKRVLNVGCGEGIGTWLLAKECGEARGIDFDREAIDTAKKNWQDSRVSFECSDFLEAEPDEYDAVVSLDVMEHILPENSSSFMRRIAANLKEHGIAVIGTLNETSSRYASPVTKAGHVNLYSGKRLEKELNGHFRHVLMFAANDEVVHTGYYPMAHYLIGIGVCPKEQQTKMGI